MKRNAASGFFTKPSRLTVQFFNDNLPHFGLLIIPSMIPGDRFSQIANAPAAYANDPTEDFPNYTVDFLS